MSPFPRPLTPGVLIRRYRRFLADVRLDDGRLETAHCANPGAMTGLDRPGSRVLLSRRDGAGRKLAYTWELVRVRRTWVCVDTAVANRVVGRWLERGVLLGAVGPVRREVRHGDVRFDFGLAGGGLVEVKTVTLAADGVGAFPDSVTERGRRHVEALAEARGRRVLCYFVARGDVHAVRPADEIDPAYGAALRRAARAGLEIVAVRAHFGPGGVRRGPLLDVLL
jgi:sugar fermentation stimulation protein A